MTKTYYLDTCVWRDFFEGRMNKAGKPIGDYAARLFMKILKNKDKVLFSEALALELKKDYNEEDIKDMLSLLFLSGILIRVDITTEESTEAKILSSQRNLPFVDCLHAIQARNHCAIMVSRDKHFINNLSDVIKTIRPEEII